MNETKQEYRKIMTRPLDLIGCECWDIGERLMLFAKFNNLLSFDPLFVYTPGKAVAVYFNFTDPKQDLRSLLSYLEKNITWFWENKKEFDENCERIREIISSSSKEYETLYNLINEIWPTITVANVYGSLEIYSVSEKLKDICIKIRQESDDVLHPGINYLSEIVSQELLSKFNFSLENTKLILMSEFLKNKIPNAEELRKRSMGYLYHRGKIFFDIEKYLEQNNIYFYEEENKSNESIIKGQIACKGIIRGIAKVVFEISDLEKVEEGDILVSPMTTPEMIVGMKKCAGIVTDEGGLTCHAAIVARELGKPCIIGTKIATKVLKDGDVVEIDAEKGIVRIK